jgi:hypothetical protein
MPIIIRSLKTSAGYLRNAPVRFADGLTCIIGARGTCKSTIVETLRFAFDCDPGRVERVLLGDPKRPAGDAPSQHGLVRATLGDGAACCEVCETRPDGAQKLTVEREVHAKPRLYREGIKELADTSLLDRIEIYSQGDLQEISQNDHLRLELIDRPNKGVISGLKAQRDKLTADLRLLGPQVRARRAEIEARRADVHGLEQLRGQLAELQSQRPALPRELDEEREGYLRRKNLLGAFEAALGNREKILAAALDALGQELDLGTLEADVPPLEIEEAITLLERLRSLREQLARQRRQLEAAQADDFQGLLAVVRDRVEARNARYNALRQEQQAVNETLRKEDALKHQIAHLERLERELEGMIQDEQQLLRRRRECREAIQRLNDQIHRLRLTEVEQINAQHSQVVMLTLEQGTRSPGYTEQLARLLQGSRLRNQEEVVRDLAERVRPSDLVDIVEGGESQRLATLLKRDLSQMARLVSYLHDAQELYDLEGIVHEDRLEITMYDGDVPKPVSQLSRGQMATALLPLILRPADYPLVFDQPEDDLDNRFIYTTLVETVRNLKARRQLVFVTHNANIPVLGEADAVVVMCMENPTEAAPALIGSVDEVKQHILTLLEGGADAFRRRHEKYQDLLR